MVPLKEQSHISVALSNLSRKKSNLDLYKIRFDLSVDEEKEIETKVRQRTSTIGRF